MWAGRRLGMLMVVQYRGGFQLGTAKCKTCWKRWPIHSIPWCWTGGMKPRYADREMPSMLPFNDTLMDSWTPEMDISDGTSGRLEGILMDNWLRWCSGNRNGARSSEWREEWRQGNEWIANRIKKVDPRWGYPSEKGERSSSDWIFQK